MNENNKNDVER